MQNVCKTHWSRSAFQYALQLLTFAADLVEATCSIDQIMPFGKSSRYILFIHFLMNMVQSVFTLCVGSVWLPAGSSWTNLLTPCRTMCLSSFVCLLQYPFSTPLKDSVHRPVRDDKIGEELDFNLSWSQRLFYFAGVTSMQRCQVIRGSLWLQQWN